MADQWFSISTSNVFLPQAKAASGTTATIDIFDEIGVWGTSAKDFTAALRDLKADTISLNVNSPGGDVFDGIAILNALRDHPARIVATVKGLAASAASFLVMGADEVVMARNAELMIHDAWGAVLGNAEDMRAMADNLQRISDNIASIYAEKAGGEPKDWRKAMRAESWYSADEAVEAGLADRVDKAKDGETAKANFNLSKFAHAGRANAPRPYVPRERLMVALANDAASFTTCVECGNDDATEGYDLCSECLEAGHKPSTEPPAEQLAEPTTPTEGTDSMPDLIQGLRSRLGIPADADLNEDDLLAALDEALSEQPATAPVENRVPEGTVLLDEAQYNDLQAAAQMGRDARERQIAEDRAAVVNSAIAEGRIPPARREHWNALLAADPGAGDVLASLAKGTVPLAPLGYTGGVDEATDDDSDIYNALFSKEG